MNSELQVSAYFKVGDTTLHVDGPSFEAVRSIYAALVPTEETAVVDAKPEAKTSKKIDKETIAAVKTEAELPKDAQEAKTETTVSAYTHDDIKEAVTAALGEKASEGYASRRAAVVELLGSFGIKSGKELKPEQFYDFMSKIAKIKG